MSVIYPNEVWPGDAEIEALDGTTDPQTGLPYIAKGTGPTSVPSYAVQYNRRQQRENLVLGTWRQGMVVDEGGLRIGVYPISFVIGGVWKSFLGATGVAVPDDASRVVYLDGSAVLQLASAWPGDPTSFLPLAQVTTASGRMTIGDRRCYAAFRVPSLEASAARDRRMVATYRASVGASQTDVEIFRFDPPVDLTLEEVQVYCTATGATASVNVKEGGASVLSAAATPVAGAVVKPAIADGQIAAANDVTVHVTTNGTGSITNLTVTLLFKAALAG